MHLSIFMYVSIPIMQPVIDKVDNAPWTCLYLNRAYNIFRMMYDRQNVCTIGKMCSAYYQMQAKKVFS